MDIGCGDYYDYITATATDSRAINDYFIRKFGPGHPNAKRKYAQGDIVTTVIRTKKGKTIVDNYDMQLPRPYDNRWLIQGTRGIYNEQRDSVYITDKSPKYHQWEPFGPYQEEYDHIWWKVMQGKVSPAGHEDTSIDKALELMREERVRRFPVVDKHGHMVGIVSEKDLLYASPSPATSLGIYEIPYLLSKIKMRDLMEREVITVTEDTTLEEAARIMADNKIGGLPVMRDDKLVGIITETDLFKIFLELLGAREEGVRLSMLVPEEKGMLAKITSKITEMGGNIQALGTIMGEDPTNRQLTIKVADVSEEQLVAAMEALDLKMLDARYCTTPTCEV